MIRFIAVASVFFVGADLYDQSIAVKGRLTCGTQPAAYVLVKLWDEDFGSTFLPWFDPHDLLDEKHSNSTGEFHLSGTTDEPTLMEPVLSIHYDCSDKSSARKVSFGLPDKYITAGRTPEKTVDIGVINLELIYKEEEMH